MVLVNVIFKCFIKILGVVVFVLILILIWYMILMKDKRINGFFNKEKYVLKLDVLLGFFFLIGVSFNNMMVKMVIII